MSAQVWRWEPGMRARASNIVGVVCVVDPDGRFLRVEMPNGKRGEFSPEVATLDLDHGGTRGLLLDQVREATGCAAAVVGAASGGFVVLTKFSFGEQLSRICATEGLALLDAITRAKAKLAPEVLSIEHDCTPEDALLSVLRVLGVTSGSVLASDVSDRVQAAVHDRPGREAIHAIDILRALFDLPEIHRGAGSHEEISTTIEHVRTVARQADRADALERAVANRDAAILVLREKLRKADDAAVKRREGDDIDARAVLLAAGWTVDEDCDWRAPDGRAGWVRVRRSGWFEPVGVDNLSADESRAFAVLCEVVR